MSNSDILKVIQAHMDGKKIQIRKMGSHQGFRDGKWYDVENPRWDFDSCDYRVTPEPPKPREFLAPEFKLMSVTPENKNYIESAFSAKAILLREVIE